MLAVDLEGYTRYASTRDAEEVHLAVRPLMNRLRLVCEQLGGVVPVIEGDGFLAVFGGLEGRPDDPQRALHAAVQLQHLVTQHRGGAPEGFPSLRAALHVGEVVVAPSWERGGFSVAGDAVNVVSRLCGIADQGAIVASVEVTRLVPHEAWSPVRPVSLRNRSEPVAVRDLGWRSVQQETFARPQVSATPFVPRPEFAVVLDALSAGQDVQLVGEPGVGKTRLAGEIAARSGAEVVLRLPCLDDDRESRAVGRLARQVVQALGARPAQLPAVVRRRLRVLAGEAVDTFERDARAELVDALVAGTTELARLSDVLLVVDDADVAQPEERELLGLVHAGAGGACRMLLTAREAVDLPARRVRVEPLATGPAAELVGHLLPGAEHDILTALLDRTGGIPMALEQYARLLLEEGTIVPEGAGYRLIDPAGLARLPAGMRLFVSSRLDRLDPEARALVSAAAVAGNEADLDLVLHLAGEGGRAAQVLEDLVDRRILATVGGSDGENLRVSFTHQVLWDVAYHALLRQQRVAKHLAAAQWYSVLPIVQLVSEEARHLETALGLGTSDCDVVRRAVQVLSEYATSLVERRTALAVDVVGRAERIVADHPDCHIDTLRLRLTKAELLRLRMQEAQAVPLAQACLTDSVERELDDLVVEASLVVGRALALSEPEVARQHFDRAQALLTRAEDRAGLALLEVARTELSDVLLGDRLARMARAHQDAVRASDMRLSALTARDLAMYGSARDPEESDQWQRTAVQLLRRDDVVGQAELEWAAAFRHYARQERRAATGALRSAGRAAGEAASQQLAVNCDLLLLECLAEAGDLEGAQAVYARMDALAQQRPTDRLRVDATLPLALVRSRQGRPLEAQQLLEDLRPHSERLGPHHVAEWHELAARQAQDVGDFAAASAHARAAVAAFRELGLEAFAFRPECLDLTSRTAAAARIGLGEVAEARARAHRFGSAFALALLSLGRQLTDLLAGDRDHEPDLHESVDEVEVRAMALETRAFWEQDPDLLLESAATWSQLGATVWPARALLWHSELTGAPHPEADELLEVLQSPAGLAGHFRSQVRALHA
jgi:class 3 adenylate cyclase